MYPLPECASCDAMRPLDEFSVLNVDQTKGICKDCSRLPVGVAAPTKRCTRCTHIKPLSAFSNRSHCKDCQAKAPGQQCLYCHDTLPLSAFAVDPSARNQHMKQCIRCLVAEPIEKQCFTCQQVKSITDYHPNRASSDGLNALCIACCKHYGTHY